MQAMQATITHQARELEKMKEDADKISLSWQEQSAENEELKSKINILKGEDVKLNEMVASRDNQIKRLREYVGWPFLSSTPFNLP